MPRSSLPPSGPNLLTCPACGASQARDVAGAQPSASYRCAACGRVARIAGWQCCVHCVYGRRRCGRRPRARARIRPAAGAPPA